MSHPEESSKETPLPPETISYVAIGLTIVLSVTFFATIILVNPLSSPDELQAETVQERAVEPTRNRVEREIQEKRETLPTEAETGNL